MCCKILHLIFAKQNHILNVVYTYYIMEINGVPLQTSEGQRFGKQLFHGRFIFWLGVLVGVLDFKTATKLFL